MRKWGMILCLLALLSLFCFGCAWTTQQTAKDTMIRCPKCGGFFSSQEGAEMLEHLRGRPETRR
jgi:hypothetical protein